MNVILRIDGPPPVTPTRDDEAREFNARGLFAIGPQAVNPSDVLAKLIDQAKGRVTDEHFAPSPDGQRRRRVRERAETVKRLAAHVGRNDHIGAHAREYLGRFATHGLRDLVRRIAS